VQPLTRRERKSIQSLPIDAAGFREQVGMLPACSCWAEAATLRDELAAARLAINAIQASTRRDARNIICDTAGPAWASAWCRTWTRGRAPRLVEHLQKVVPGGWSCTSRGIASGWWYTDTAHPAFQAALPRPAQGLRARAGGHWLRRLHSLRGALRQELGGVPALLIGVEDPYTNAHSENESLHLGDWEKAVRSAIYLYEELARELSATP
jgi:hypothetical protein